MQVIDFSTWFIHNCDVGRKGIKYWNIFRDLICAFFIRLMAGMNMFFNMFFFMALYDTCNGIPWLHDTANTYVAILTNTHFNYFLHGRSVDFKWCIQKQARISSFGLFALLVVLRCMIF